MSLTNRPKKPRPESACAGLALRLSFPVSLLIAFSRSAAAFPARFRLQPTTMRRPLCSNSAESKSSEPPPGFSCAFREGCRSHRISTLMISPSSGISATGIAQTAGPTPGTDRRTAAVSASTASFARRLPILSSTSEI